MAFLLFILSWVALGLVAAGFDYAYFRCKFPNGNDQRDQLGESLIIAFGGPIALVVSFLVSGFGRHGWWLWNKVDRERSK